MFDPSGPTWPVNQSPMPCPRCDFYVEPMIDVCPQCGFKFDDPIANASYWPTESPIDEAFHPQYGILLQVLPSGDCLTHPIRESLLLGRDLITDLEHGIDLNPMNAHQHGVSRHHCLLQRRAARLVITDLGSTNGTYLNRTKLKFHIDYGVNNGDHVILGTLHLIVSFIPA